LKNKAHLTLEGLEEILTIKAGMNKGRGHGSDELTPGGVIIENSSSITA